MENKKTLSILTLIFGITPWVVMWIPGLSLLQIPSAIAAVVLGIIAKGKEGKNAMRTIGLILGIVSLVLTVLGVILIFLAADAVLNLM